MKTILLDIDGVVADFEGAVRATVAKVGYVMPPATRWDFTAELPPDARSYYMQQSAAPGWCSVIWVYFGAREFVAELKKLGRVVAVTAPLLHCPTWEYERRAWLTEKLDLREVVSTAHKELVYGDVLIEDSVDNLHRWYYSTPDGCEGILVQHEYNKAADWPRWAPAHDFDALLEAVRRAAA